MRKEGTRHHQFGEGDYDASERVIQHLLAEAGAAAVPSALASVEPKGAAVGADWKELKSPENYLGHERTSNFVSRDGTIADKHHLYVAPPPHCDPIIGLCRATGSLVISRLSPPRGTPRSSTSSMRAI